MARTIILMCAPDTKNQNLTPKGLRQTEYVGKEVSAKKLIPDKILYSTQPGADEVARKLRTIFAEAGKEVLIEQTEWLQNGCADQKYIRTIGCDSPTYPHSVLMITGAGNFNHLTRQFHLSIKIGTTAVPFTPAPGLAHTFTNRETDTWIDFNATPGKVERLAVISPPK